MKFIILASGSKGNSTLIISNKQELLLIDAGISYKEIKEKINRYGYDINDIKHVLIMGRVTSGKGGTILLAKANEVLKTEFPELAEKCELHIPDEKARRVGQSVAAASLPKIN